MFSLLLLAKLSSFGQGKVVINEYMPWSGCSTTSEFIELFNFGPGPADISCYIVTNGQYAVTIPPKTTILPGQYYVLAGQDVLPAGCGNIDSAVKVQLNWTTCNCTDKPVPTTGDGLMRDGGGANEKVILLNPDLKVIDAVTRSLPVSASTTITTPTLANGCTGKTFNLNDMAINYEVLGMATGKTNSFARQVDGDCGWVKTPQQSAHAPNKTGSTSSVLYDLTFTQALDCGGSGGSVSIHVNGTNVSSLFPMNYTLAYDSNNDGTYDFNDQYVYGTDDTPPTINISGLKAGRYNITVSSALDCNLRTFPLTILPCYPVLPVQLVSFQATTSTGNEQILNWTLNSTENLQKIIIEQSKDGVSFAEAATIAASSTGTKSYRYPVSITYTYYRLHIYNRDGGSFYSPVITIQLQDSFAINKLWPNPVKDRVSVELYAPVDGLFTYEIYTLKNTIAAEGKVQLHSGKNTLSIAVNQLPSGIYQLVFRSQKAVPISFRFVK